jgi:hypothetical protein
MSRRMLALSVALCTAPTAMAGYSGGGVTFQQAYQAPSGERWAGGYDVRSPSVLRCLGGQGFSTLGVLRFGAEGHACADPFDVTTGTGFGGPQLGLQFGRGVYVAGLLTVGAGVQSLQGQRDELLQIFGFARPELAVGVPLGWLGLEFSAFAMMPVPVVQFRDAQRVSGGMPTSVGVEFSIMVGRFRAPRRPAVVQVATAPEFRSESTGLAAPPDSVSRGGPMGPSVIQPSDLPQFVAVPEDGAVPLAPSAPGLDSSGHEEGAMVPPTVVPSGIPEAAPDPSLEIPLAVPMIPDPPSTSAGDRSESEGAEDSEASSGVGWGPEIEELDL